MSKIIGVGTDIIEIDRVIKACHKTSFLTKNYTDSEQKLINQRPLRAASNFAGKEAVSKAFGTGFSSFKLSDIEILRNDKGAPYVVLHGAAKTLAKDMNITHMHISLSDTDTLAIAYAVAEGDN